MTAGAPEQELRKALAARGRSLFARGLSPGTSGNLSVRLEDGFLVTPTNASLGELDPSFRVFESSVSSTKWNTSASGTSSSARAANVGGSESTVWTNPIVGVAHSRRS